MNFQNKSVGRGSASGLLNQKTILFVLSGLSFLFSYSLYSSSKTFCTASVNSAISTMHASEIAATDSLEKKIDRLEVSIGQLRYQLQNVKSASNSVGGDARVADAVPQPLVPPPGSGGQDLELSMKMFNTDRSIYHLYGQLRSKAPERITLRKAKAVIVTGANSAYFHGLTNLIGSVHFWSPDRNIVVFDLGLDPAQRQELLQMDRVRVIDSPKKNEVEEICLEGLLHPLGHANIRQDHLVGCRERFAG